jgi:hypothetical protein
MPFYNVKKSFNSSSPEKVLVAARKVITALTGNSVFINPKPSVANLIDQATHLEKAISQANNRGNITLSIVSSERTNMIAMLSEVAESISLAAQGNKADILAAGFEPARQYGKVHFPVQVQSHEVIYNHDADNLLLRWRLNIGI